MCKTGSRPLVIPVLHSSLVIHFPWRWPPWQPHYGFSMASVEISSHIFNDSGLPLAASRFFRSYRIAILNLHKLFAALAVLAA
jgi:hypothetical protein